MTNSRNYEFKKGCQSKLSDDMRIFMEKLLEIVFEFEAKERSLRRAARKARLRTR